MFPERSLKPGRLLSIKLKRVDLNHQFRMLLRDFFSNESWCVGHSVSIINDELFSEKQILIHDNYDIEWNNTTYQELGFHFNSIQVSENPPHPRIYIWNENEIKSFNNSNCSKQKISFGITLNYELSQHLRCAISISSCELKLYDNNSNSELCKKNYIIFISNILKNTMVTCCIPEFKESNYKTNLSKLSLIEMEVLRYSADGYSAKEIASKIHRTKSAVDFHLMNILKKTKCKNKVQAVAYALKFGIL